MSRRDDLSHDSVTQRTSMTQRTRAEDYGLDATPTYYEAFDPIDYVVADNVIDFRAARYQKMREQKELRDNDRHKSHRHDVEADERLRQQRAAREARCEKIRVKREERARSEEQRLAKCPACHWGLFVLTVLLTIFSVPIVYSASTAIALDHHGNADFFFVRQLGYAVVGIGAFLTMSRLNVKQIRAGVWILYAISVLGLAATDFTPLGHSLAGVERWIKIGPLTLQMSELAKIALIGVMADFWSRAARPAQKSLWPWLAAAALSAPIVGLVLMQPHLSAASLLMLLPFAVAFYADVPVRQMIKVAAVCSVLMLGVFVFGKQSGLIKPYQEQRIAAFVSGKDDQQGSDYQAMQSQRALSNGGLLGYGPGNSPSKHGFLPAPHTDFILAVIGEEWGLAGVIALLYIYGAMIFFCFHIGHCANSSFGALLCSGVGTLLAIQVIGNAGVVTGTLPVTGMPLPLLSYGGSGLICMLVGIGLVLGVSREMGRNAVETDTADLAEHLITSESSAASTHNSPRITPRSVAKNGNARRVGSTA